MTPSTLDIPDFGKLIEVTKLQAARSQLDTAIDLWFSGADSISAHTLAHASHEIIHRLYRNSGHSDLMYDTGVVKKEMRGEWAVMLKEDGNFFKHADNKSKPDDKQEYHTGRPFLFMFMSVVALSRMGYSLNFVESALMAFSATHWPHWFSQRLEDQLPPNAFAQLREIKRSQFLELFKQASGGIFK